jgi:hypothetical protein
MEDKMYNFTATLYNTDGTVFYGPKTTSNRFLWTAKLRKFFVETLMSNVEDQTIKVTINKI